MSVVYLRKGNLSRLVRGHPWIYANEIAKVTGEPRHGDIVKVSDHRQRPMGCGLFNAKSQIAVRRLSQRASVEVSESLFRERIGSAWAFRRQHLRDLSCCRVVNSESDFLPGLILDKYHDRFVMQTLTLGMDMRKREILAAIEAIFQPATVIERNDAIVRKLEGLEPTKSVLKGEDSLARLDAMVGGLRYQVDLLEGHKGGLYLDQCANHLAVGRFARGRRVLDAFSYEGGFALQCLAQGARSVAAVEISEPSAAKIAANARANGLEASLAVHNQNAFDFLKQADAARGDGDAPYDMVVLDPPSFTRNRDSLPDALRGYKEINLRACKLLSRGGMLATFCCSHHVNREMFLDVVLDAATDAHRTLRLIDTLGQNHDHPILPAVPETEYLKGFVFEITD